MPQCARSVLFALCLVLFPSVGLGGRNDAADWDPQVMEQLRLLAGHPDIKPGVAMSKAAAWAWMSRHIVEEYAPDHLRVNLTMQRGQMLLPYAVNYVFQDGVLISYDFEQRNAPPDVERARQRDGDAMPWLSIDRSLWGYRFLIPVTWTLLHEQGVAVGGSSGRLTIVGLTKVHDPELDAWIENSLQWCVYERKKPFRKVSEVMALDEKRLKESGTKIVKRTKTAHEHGFLYETTFRDHSYLGKTYFFIFEGQGIVLRFNATKGTYPINLPRFERFVHGFELGRQRAENPDLELIQDGDTTITAVGGAFTAQELKGLKREFR